MSLFVDTSVWSLAFRRDAPDHSPHVVALRESLESGNQLVVTTGLVLQELLQGFSEPRASKQIIAMFGALPFVTPDRDDHLKAAALRNQCRRRGVQLGTIDALLAHLCIRHHLTLLTTDRDFVHASAHCALRLWQSPEA